MELQQVEADQNFAQITMTDERLAMVSIESETA